MKKLTKLLSVFAIVGALTAGIGAAAGCAHNHTYESGWSYDDETGHYHKSTCGHDDSKKEAHVFDDEGKCECGYEKGGTVVTPPVDGVEAPAGTKNLAVAMDTVEFNLTKAAPDVTIDPTKATVKYMNGATETGAAKNSDATFYLTDASGTPLTGFKLTEGGTYYLYAEISAKVDGAAKKLKGELMITVNNPIVASTFKRLTAAGAATTQVAGASDTISANWTYEVERSNGAKVAIAAKDVTVALETNVVGENKKATATATVDKVALSVEVTYTITANANAHATSYATNFSSFGNVTLAENTQLKQGEKVVATMCANDNKAKTTAADQEFDGRYFDTRFQFGGGTFTKAGSLQKHNRWFKIDTEGAAKITVIWHTGNADRGIALYDVAETKKITQDNAIYKKTVKTTELQKEVIDVTKAGSYYLTTATDGDVYMYYIQVENMVEGAGTDVTLPTATEAQGIKVTTTKEGTEFKKGATFATTGVTVQKRVLNPVTRAVTYQAIDDAANIAYTGYDMSKLGKQTVNVAYGDFKASYGITVFTQLTGIYGVNAALAASVNTQVANADAKFTLNKDDVKLEFVGENENASITSWTAKNGTTDVTFPAEFAVGEVTLTLSVVITDGTNNDTVEVELKFSVAVASTDPIQSFLAPDTLPATTAIAAGATITDNNLFKVIADGAMEYSLGDKGADGIPNSGKPVTAKVQDGSTKTFKSGIRTAKSSAANVQTTSVQIVAKQKITLQIHALVGNDGYNSNRPGKVYYKIGDGTAQSSATSDRQAPATIKVTLEAGQTLTVYGTGDDEGVRLYLFGVEATKVATATASVEALPADKKAQV